MDVFLLINIDLPIKKKRYETERGTYLKHVAHAPNKYQFGHSVMRHIYYTSLVLNLQLNISYSKGISQAVHCVFEK